MESVLLYQLDTNLYMRQVENKKHNNFELTLKENSELANYIMKEPYVFDLIELTENYKEKELENKMLERLKNVLLELGNGFSFVGSQYKITVGNQDFYIDLLFYHINPSIGILLCQSKNNEIVDYTLKYINKPLGVSEYKIFNELPENLLKELPTEEEINLHLDIEEENE